MVDDLAMSCFGVPEADKERLRPIYLEHKDRFGPGTPAHELYENGVDVTAGDDEWIDGTEPTGCPGC